MSPSQKTKKIGSYKDLLNGGALQCMEAATLGMPFEVWKTRMARFRTETSRQSFVALYQRGGILEFWNGTSAKLVESALKGAVLLYSKEAIFDIAKTFNCTDTGAGFVAGAGGGVCQTVVMSPCTFIVTALVTGNDRNITITNKVKEIWSSQGIRGFYSGASAIAFRQATNWASRQGITEAMREIFLQNLHHNENTPKLTKTEEILSGIIGGAISTWNQPFEVARVSMQSRANEGKSKLSLPTTLYTIFKGEGIGGLFKGIVPRIGLSVWQTLFMVTGAKLIRENLLW